jgi:ATP-binding cassette, subfamily F, member 3
MSLLVANNLTKFYGPDEVFSNLSLEIPPKARVALVGPNGAGKTTLINILAGLDSATDGRVVRAKNSRIAFLPQRPELAGDHTVWEEQLKAFEDLREMETQLSELEHQMADADTYDQALEDYGPLQAEFERLGGYTYETRIKMVLTGVGFKPDEYDTPLPKLSGGQKTRTMMCRLLLEEPDMLILDEPTNHLDIYAVEWLENFLRAFPGAVLAVSHDRYFIDHFATTVWELEFKQLELYRGNYTHYLKQRGERRERRQKEFDSQNDFVSKEMDYIRKHMGSRWTAQAKGRLKKLETMKKRGKILESAPRNRQTMKLNINTNLRSGDQVIITDDLVVGYEQDNPLVNVPDVLVIRGETVAIIGPNGVGKSTLLKTVLKELDALAGEARLGANVKVGYFAQAHELLNSNNSVLDEIISAKPMGIGEARNVLGRFMFSNDDVFRSVDTLSGGERGRVALAKLALQGANLLLLDEPTNHLDIDSQEILQAVLENFEGTILLVSHDRYLIDQLATQIWDISPLKLSVFEGTYQEFITTRNQRLAQQQAQAQTSKNSAPNGNKGANYTAKKYGLNPYEVKKKVAKLEATIEELEIKLGEITAQLDEASIKGDAAKVTKLGATYTQTEAELEAIVDEWGKFAD